MRPSLFFLAFVLIANLAYSQCEPDEVELRVEIATDQWAGETSWTITDDSENILIQGGQDGAYDNYSTYSYSICVDNEGCYFFEIWDTYGDGIFAPYGYEVYVDDVLIASGADDIGSYAQVNLYCPASCGWVQDALIELQDHINEVTPLTGEQLLEIRDILFQFPSCLGFSEELILLGKSVVEDYDTENGALFTTPETEYGFSKDPDVDTGLELEHAMVALQQAIFDFTFTNNVYEQYPQHLHSWKFNSCVNFPGEVNPPADSTVAVTTLIRANFEDPAGMNPYFNINGDGTDHALRPTGTYLSPGSFATVTVPAELVGQDYYVRVGSHEWDLSNKPRYKRLDRVSKKFPINSTTVVVFNPLGGAISILVPYGADEGIVEMSVNNAVEAPFFSLKSFHLTDDVDAELEKPGPWAVFESDNVMYTIPKHSIIPGQNDLMQTLEDWETAVRGVNSIMAREIIPDKHNMYMISDLIIRGGAFSIGYPMSNTPQDYIDVPGPAYFVNGPGPDDEVNFHETGHALAMSKFPGEIEAIVNFPYIMAMNYGLGVDLNEAVNYSFVPNTFDIDKTATHRMVSNTFGTERDISNTTTDEVRYQHRGYGHYFEIVNMLGWCPLRNFWRQEYIDYQNGIDHGINGQDIDSRIIRLCEAAMADLRPLFHVYGILPQDPEAVQQALDEAGVEPSLIVYNRLYEYYDLIPEDNAAFVDYALFMYPNLYDDGPDADPNYGVGWHYLKSLSYDNVEANERTLILQDIIELYFPEGAPVPGNEPDVCCTMNPITISLEEDEIVVMGGVPPYEISSETDGDTQIVSVIDYDNCTASEEFMVSNTAELAEEALSIYPNPSNGMLHLQMVTDERRDIEVYDSRGKLVFSSSITFSFTTLDLSQLSDGLYVIRIGDYTEKLLLMKGGE